MVIFYTTNLEVTTVVGFLKSNFSARSISNLIERGSMYEEEN